MNTQWTEDDQNHLNDLKRLSEKHYKLHRERLNKPYTSLLDEAIEQGYIEVPGTGVNASNALLAYEHWCGSHAKPLIQVLPGPNKFHVRIELDLRSMRPFGAPNRDCPDLDLEDAEFRRLMLLCNENSYSEYHLVLRCVLKDHVADVIHELLVWYDRSAQKHREDHV